MTQNQLSIPEAALDNKNAFEIVRIWIADGHQHFILRTDCWNDPAAWGLLLADLVRNIAASYERNTNREFEDVVERIRIGFDAEMENPTD